MTKTDAVVYRQNMKSTTKHISAIVKGIQARFIEQCDRVPKANRYPLAGFSVDVVEALKRIHPDLTALSYNIEITLSFKNGAACNQWLTTGKTSDHLAVKQAVKSFSDCLAFHHYGEDGQKWKGLVRLKVGKFEIYQQYAVAPGTIDPSGVISWYCFQVADNGVSIPVAE